MIALTFVIVFVTFRAHGDVEPPRCPPSIVALYCARRQAPKVPTWGPRR